jgi:hypothetical protein
VKTQQFIYLKKLEKLKESIRKEIAKTRPKLKKNKSRQ